jgi:NCAIR mutase (PurE)-related protein
VYYGSSHIHSDIRKTVRSSQRGFSASFFQSIGRNGNLLSTARFQRAVFLEGNMKKVAVIMGSDSDLPIMKKAMQVLADYGVPFEAHVYSAHRTPVQAAEFAENARANGFGAIIAGAGMAAALAGVLAGHTTLPVIGVPLKSAVLEGTDAL